MKNGEYPADRETAARLRKLQKLADRLANRRTARLSRQEKLNSHFLKPDRESLDLRRFSASLRAFKRNEWQSRHDVTCAQALRL